MHRREFLKVLGLSVGAPGLLGGLLRQVAQPWVWDTPARIRTIHTTWMMPMAKVSEKQIESLEGVFYANGVLRHTWDPGIPYLTSSFTGEVPLGEDPPDSA